MASEWIKWVRGFSRKPEVLHIARSLGVTRREVATLCMEFWEWADDNVTSENESAECPGFVRVASASEDFVDEIVAVSGFAKAMSSVGWLTIRTGSIEFPKFGRHNSKSAKRRALDAERKRTSRDPQSADRPQDVPETSASKADKKKTRGEERRVSSSSETESLQKNRIFTPPTVEEVRQYCDERKNGVDPNRWLDHYTANGWMVGKTKMKDWKASVRTWEGNSTGPPPPAKPRSKVPTAEDMARWNPVDGGIEQ